MIQVEEKETIRRLYFNQRHSIREIAKERGHSRKTVKKAIGNASVPEYHLTKARPSPVMDPFKALIGSLAGGRQAPAPQTAPHRPPCIYQAGERASV